MRLETEARVEFFYAEDEGEIQNESS